MNKNELQTEISPLSYCISGLIQMTSSVLNPPKSIQVTSNLIHYFTGSDPSQRSCCCWLFEAYFAQQLLRDDSPKAAVTHDKKKKSKDKVERADGRSQIKRCLARGSDYLRRERATRCRAPGPCRAPGCSAGRCSAHCCSPASLKPKCWTPSPKRSWAPELCGTFIQKVRTWPARSSW